MTNHSKSKGYSSKKPLSAQDRQNIDVLFRKIEKGLFYEAKDVFKNKIYNKHHRRNKNIKDAIKKKISDKIKGFESNNQNFFNLSPENRLRYVFLLALYLVIDGVKQNQLRKINSLSSRIYRQVRRKSYEMNIKEDTARIRYLMAYTTSRHQSLDILMRSLDPILNNLQDETQYLLVHEYLQGILAYHKFLGGQD